MSIVKSLVRQHFSDHAREYDLYARVQKVVVARLVESIAGSLPEDGFFLDIGTGTGELSQALKRRAPSLQPIVTDLAHGMTACALDKVPGSIGCDADAIALPFSDESFPLVVSTSVYQWVNDLPGAFAEAYRVLKPGGTFAVSLFAENTLCELQQARNAVAVEMADANLSRMQQFPLRTAVESALSAVGFCETSMDEYMEVEYHPDLKTLLHSLKQIGAQNASTERSRSIVSRKAFRFLDSYYLDNFNTPDGVAASYHVISFRCHK